MAKRLRTLFNYDIQTIVIAVKFDADNTLSASWFFSFLYESSQPSRIAIQLSSLSSQLQSLSIQEDFSKNLAGLGWNDSWTNSILVEPRYATKKRRNMNLSFPDSRAKLWDSLRETPYELQIFFWSDSSCYDDLVDGSGNAEHDISELFFGNAG